MLKRASQLTALFAILASVLNTQCLLACSLNTAPIASSHAAATVAEAGHSCCPDEHPSTQPAQENHHKNCPDPSPTLSRAESNTAQHPSHFAVTLLPFSVSPLPAPPSAAVAARDFSTLAQPIGRPPSLTILRI